MKIRFLKDCGFTVIEKFDEETETAEEYDETFRTGEIFEGDIIDDEDKYVSFQFGDGSIITGLKKDLYEVIKA